MRCTEATRQCWSESTLRSTSAPRLSACHESNDSPAGKRRSANALLQHLPLVRVVQVPPRTRVLHNPPIQAVVAQRLQDRAAVLVGDQAVPGVVDQRLAVLVRRQVAVGVVGRKRGQRTLFT